MNGYDCVVVGGGPSGGASPTDLAAAARHNVLLLARMIGLSDIGADVLADQAAEGGFVGEAPGEGVYHPMVAGGQAASAGRAFFKSGNPRALRQSRHCIMRANSQVIWILEIMQRFWYHNDRRRERFVVMCQDRDLQKLLWPAFINRRLIYAAPMAYLRMFFKDMRHLPQTAR
jgi:geranylgeranyl reductase